MTGKGYTNTRFSAQAAALVLIDHQTGIMQLVHYYSPAEFRSNVIGLAKLGKVFNLPAVLTTSLGQGPNGPFCPGGAEPFSRCAGDRPTWNHQRVG